MTLEQSTVTFGVLAAAFVFSALYQIYRTVLMEVPEYDAFGRPRSWSSCGWAAAASRRR
jgi:hypothetical protein